MKGKIARLTIVSIVAMLLAGMIPAFVAAPPPPAIYIDGAWSTSGIITTPDGIPDTYTFNTGANPVGFKWKIAIWINSGVNVFAWQVKLTFNSAFLKCDGAGYAGPLFPPANTPTSEYFAGHTTVPVTPVILPGSVQLAEGLLGSDFVGPGNAKLMWVELEITAAPEKYETLTSVLDLTSSDTWFQNADTSEYVEAGIDSSLSYAWTAPQAPFMGFDPHGTVMVSNEYDKTWNTTTLTKQVKIKELDAAWHLSSASFKVNYNIGDPFLGVVSITPDPLWGSVVIDTSVPNVIGVTATAPTSTPSGNVLVITIVFNLVYKDDYLVDTQDECDVTFSDVALFDTIAAIPTRPSETEHDINMGLLSLKLPYLKVVPETTVLGPEPVAGTTFDVAVDIRRLDSHWYLIGAQFRLAYDASVVEPVDCVEGPFLQDFGYLPPPYQPGSLGSFFISFFEPGPPDGPHVIVGNLILPNETGFWNEPFPGTIGEPTDADGGTIAIITFKVIKQIYPTNITGAFTIFETLFVDWNGNEIPHADPQNGQVIIAGSPLPGRDIDVYTQYPAPFGGQGPDKPSDMFWPQKEIVLTAFVTYNWWPMQQKLVGFEIKDPQGNTWAKLSAVTNVDGLATVSVRLPWPCDDPESLFGVWHVIATVDIACIVVNDTLDFHYDYLGRIFKVTITPPACGNDLNFAHCDNVEITVEYGTYAMQTYPAVISFVLSDEVNVPVGIDLVELTIGGATYCSYKKGTVTLSIHIPKFAVAGVGTLHVNIFDFDPFEGGIPLSPEFSPAPTIFITPY
jgi:hypothetical protein